jgi:hypothetical protein
MLNFENLVIYRFTMILVFLCFENLLVTAGLSGSLYINNLELRISSKKLLKSETYMNVKSS